MLKFFLLSLIISYMGFAPLQSKEPNQYIEESFFNVIHQSIDQGDLFQAQTALVQMISESLLLKENFDYENFQTAKYQIFERLIVDYETVPIILCQLFERISWQDTQKEFAVYKKQIQKNIKKLFVSAHHQSFFHLPLLEQDKKNIKIIIKTMAEKGLVKLLFDRRYLERKGDQVNYVHPLRFIGYIFSNQELKSCMRKIKESRFKWNEFISGFSRRMEEEYAVDNLQYYIPEFIEQVHPKHPERIKIFIEEKAWEGLIANLLH